MIQDDNLLIYTGNASLDLSEKDEATLLVISDSHGNENALLSALQDSGRECDALIFCGDGMDDLCSVLQMSLSREALSSFIPPVIAAVEGNNDDSHYIYSDYDTVVPLALPLVQVLEVCSHKILITHGHRFSLYNGTKYLTDVASTNGAELVLYGHTHVAYAQNNSGVLCINPGSCARPRDGQPPCYGVLKLKKGSNKAEFTVYRLDKAEKVPYLLPTNFLLG